MGISYRNGSGYPDPTAYEAVRLMEAEARILRIEYPTGYIELNMEAAFPATLDRAKKIFRLVHRYCDEADQRRLLGFLAKKEQHYAAQAQTFLQKVANSKPHSADEHQHESRSREALRLQQRTHRNIELFREG